MFAFTSIFLLPFYVRILLRGENKMELTVRNWGQKQNLNEIVKLYTLKK